MTEMEKPGFWAILPADVRYDEELSSTAKLLYAEISALQKAKGFCYARNSYFAEVFGISERTAQRTIRELEQRGYISIQIARGADGDLVRLMRVEVNPSVSLTAAASPCTGETKAGAPQTTDEELLAGQDTEAELEHQNGSPTGDMESEDMASCEENGQNCHGVTNLSGGDKNVVEGVTKMSPMNNTSNNKTSNTPLKPPQGGKRTRRQKTTPNHKPERFEAFWAYYRRVGRGENRQGAVRAWDRLSPPDELIDRMAKALKRQSKSEDWQRGIGIPYAATWLNNARWEDEIGMPQADTPGPVDARGGLDAW